MSVIRHGAERVLAWSMASLLSVAGLSGAATDLRLVEAVRNRDKDRARVLLKQKIDVNAPQPDGATALHWAAHWDDVETADLLIRAGAHVNTANEYGVTPLWLACTNGNPVMVDRLLRAGADPNTAFPAGGTALMNAARTGNAEVVKTLLIRRADVGAKEPAQGQTALMWAAAEGHARVVQMLVEHGAAVHARSTAGFTPLLFAARHGHLAATRVLLSAGANVNEATPDGTTALLIATIRGHIEYAGFFLEQGADPDLGPGFTPLHWAAGEWHTELTGATTGVLADDTEWSTLGGLRGEAKRAFVKMLLAHGANPNARAERNPRYTGGGGGRGNLAGGTPFLMAAMAGDVDLMRLLVAAGADSLVVTTRGTTPLMMAAGLGGTPGISWVTESHALEAVKLALELGGDVNAVDAAGETALHGAAYRGWNTVVTFLVESGAKLNVKNKNGWTPLTIAEGVYASNYNEFPSTAELLRKLGADPTPPDVERDGTVLRGRQQ